MQSDTIRACFHSFTRPQNGNSLQNWVALPPQRKLNSYLNSLLLMPVHEMHLRPAWLVLPSRRCTFPLANTVRIPQQRVFKNKDVGSYIVPGPTSLWTIGWVWIGGNRPIVDRDVGSYPAFRGFIDAQHVLVGYFRLLRMLLFNRLQDT